MHGAHAPPRAVDFDYDQRRSVLSVNLGHASGLVFPPDNITSMGVARNLFIHARVQLLPSTNTTRINTSLFSLNPPKPSVYRRMSQLHRETACPVFREVCCLSLTVLRTHSSTIELRV